MFLPPVVLFTIDLQTGHLEEREHARIILLLLSTMKFFVFFPNQFFSKIIFSFFRYDVRKSRGI